MKVLHQLGFRHNWNLASYTEDNAGDGLIFSPVNLENEKLTKISTDIKKTSFFDPQIYLPESEKGKFESYDYFPSNMVDEFVTQDFDNISTEISEKCIDLQIRNDFEFIVIPTRHHNENPSDYYQKQKSFFIDHFTDYLAQIDSNKPVLLTVLVKSGSITDEVKRNFLLNWITGIQEVDGVYLIFENNFPTKQIKDTDFLFNALLFIRSLKENGLIVNVGYTNTESLIYSLANPDAITMGSYENLRNFKVDRFVKKENEQMRSPNARIYSAKLMQWIDYNYLAALKNLYPNYEELFEDSVYKPLMFKPDYKWHTTKPDPYKHFFIVFSQQIKSLPSNRNERFEFLEQKIKQSIELFQNIENRGVLLDDNSNGSHLYSWINALTMFKNS